VIKMAKGNIAIVDGKVLNDVEFVNTREEAQSEVLYDKINIEHGKLVYRYHGQIVAVKEL